MRALCTVLAMVCLVVLLEHAVGRVTLFQSRQLPEIGARLASRPAASLPNCRLPPCLSAAGRAAAGVSWGEAVVCSNPQPTLSNARLCGKQKRCLLLLWLADDCRAAAQAGPAALAVCAQVPVIAATATATADVKKSIVSES